MQHCQGCGTALSANARFCQRCGKPVAPIPPTPQHHAQPPPEPQYPTGPQTSPWGPTAALRRPGSGLAVSCSVLIVFLVGLSVALIGIIATAGSYMSNDEELAAGVVATIMCAFSVLYGILYLVWLYKTWSAVPPQHRSTSPGAAVGLLFVPAFNIYWVFRAVVGLSRSLERALANRPQAGPPGAGSGLAIASCVMALIPGPNCVAWILFIIWINVANSAKNRLLRAELRSRPGPAGL